MEHVNVTTIDAVKVPYMNHITLEKLHHKNIRELCFTSATTSYTVNRSYRYLVKNVDINYIFLKVDTKMKDGLYMFFFTIDINTNKTNLYVSKLTTFFEAIESINEVALYVSNNTASTEFLVMFGYMDKKMTPVISNNAADMMDIEKKISCCFANQILKLYAETFTTNVKKIEGDIASLINRLIPSYKLEMIPKKHILKPTNFQLDLRDIPPGINVVATRRCNSNSFDDLLNRKVFDLKHQKQLRLRSSFTTLSTFEKIKTYFETKISGKVLENTKIFSNIYCKRVRTFYDTDTTLVSQLHDIIFTINNKTSKLKKPLILWGLQNLGAESFFGKLLVGNMTYFENGIEITKNIILKIAIPSTEYVVENESDSAQMMREIHMNKYASDAGIAPEVHFSVILNSANKKQLLEHIKQIISSNTFFENYEASGEVMLMGMEFVRGRTLNDMVDKRKYAKKAIEKVEDMHNIGLIHGDLHPGNIMIDDNGKILIIDFGLSHLISNTPDFSYGKFKFNNQELSQGFVNVKKKTNLWNYERPNQSHMLFKAAEFDKLPQQNRPDIFEITGSKITSCMQSKIPSYNINLFQDVNRTRNLVDRLETLVGGSVPKKRTLKSQTSKRKTLKKMRQFNNIDMNLQFETGKYYKNIRNVYPTEEEKESIHKLLRDTPTEEKTNLFG